MARHENPNQPLGTVVEILALYRLRLIKPEDFDPNDLKNLGYYFGRLIDDPELERLVNRRVGQLTQESAGIKSPLFPAEVTNKMKKRKKPRKKQKPPRQLSFLTPDTHEDKPNTFEFEVNPIAKIDKLGHYLDSPTHRGRRSPLSKIVQQRKRELRDMIGLPIARGKSPYIKNRFYKFLVRNICDYDVFGIFMLYDRVLGEIPEDLSLKIEEITRLINELLNPTLTPREAYGSFRDFLQEYWERWKII